MTNWCSPYSQNTMFSFEYISFLPKILLFRNHHLKNSTTELILIKSLSTMKIMLILLSCSSLCTQFAETLFEVHLVSLWSDYLSGELVDDYFFSRMITHRLIRFSPLNNYLNYGCHENNFYEFNHSCQESIIYYI